MTDYYEIGPDVQWPAPQLVVRDWLVSHLAANVNVRTETDSTFATATPNASMTVPLVLVQSVPGGSYVLDNQTTVNVIDVSCFDATEVDAVTLFGQVNAWMLRLTSKRTAYGVVDEVSVDNPAGVVTYSNPNVRRIIATYGLATRAQFSI